jgi:hypothetical protein
MRALHRLRQQGVTLKHPTWGGNSIGFMPFPVLGDAQEQSEGRP